METVMGQPGGKINGSKVIHRIMPSRFRPIAPKPVPPGSDAAAAKLALYVRTKRKYVKKIKPIKNNTVKKGGGGCKRDVMLESPAVGGGCGCREEGEGSSTMWIRALAQPPPISIYPSKTADSRNPPRRVVVSWMIVHSMEETVPGHGMVIGSLSGDTDDEKMMNLQNDTCPILVSDCEQSVKYTNLAYKEMVVVVGDEAEEVEEEGGLRPLVSLVLEEEVPEAWTMFTCIGRVEYIWGQKKHTQSMPCDVWRMDFGGFVWKLDANAALTLGR